MRRSPDSPTDADASAYGESLAQIEPYGGFGLEMMQTPIGRHRHARSLWIGSPSSVCVSHRCRVAAPRPRVRSSRSGPATRTARVGYQLPTGSLDWPAASGVILYSPALRYENYGGGYGRGPYGTMDCGMMYHGMSLGY